MGKDKDPDSADQTGAAGKAAGEGADGSREASASGAKSKSGRGRRGGGKAAATEGRSSESRTEPASGGGESRSGEAGSEGTKAERTKSEGTKAEATKAEETKAGKSEGAESGSGEPKSGKPKPEPAAADEAKSEDTKAKKPTAEKPTSPGRADTESTGTVDEEIAARRAATEADKGLEATRADELAYHDATMAELADERGHRSVYATLFFILLGAIVVAGLTLWGAPKVAPYLPGPVAQYLMPGQPETAARLADLEARLAARAEQTESAVAGLNERLDALAAELEATARAEEIRASMGELRQTAETAASEAAGLAERVEGLDSRVAGLREELNAVSETLSGAGEAATPSELSAALAALRSRVDQLAEAVEGGPPTAELAARLGTLAERVAELEASLAAARESEGEVSSAIRQTRLQSAFDVLAGRLAAGQPYAGTLSEIAELAGTAPPEPLAAAADSGLATAAQLEASFGRHAQAAIAAGIRAASGDSAWGQALGWLRAQVAGRPVAAQEGDGVPAITSRIAAHVEAGQLDAALAEAETLPAPSREALGPWLERLRARVGAEAVLAEWRDRVLAKG